MPRPSLPLALLASIVIAFAPRAASAADPANPALGVSPGAPTAPPASPPGPAEAPAATGGQAAPSPAGADAPRTVWDRHVSMYAHLGVGIPNGMLGLSFVYTPVPLLSLELGGGAIGGLGTAFINGTFMVHVKPIRAENWALTLGAGPSVGVFHDSGSSGDDSGGGSVDNERAVWANFELGAEGRFQSGFSVRFAVGMSALLNPGDTKCSPPKGAVNCDSFLQRTMPDFNFSIGFVGL